ncbi:MAG: hypothetical protein ACXWZ7_09020 [Gemmatirosa sp.]
MRPTVLAALVPALLAAPVALRAQAPAQPAANTAAAPVVLPGGWSMRLDRDGAATGALKFFAMGTGLHATTGPSAIFYDATMTAKGAYTAEATFTQTKAPAHAEAYGLVFGGSGLGGPQQDYMYFVVRGDGKFLVKHRAGTEVHLLKDWTAHTAITPADAAGKATNALRVRVAPDSVRFDVNGAQVFALPRVANLKTDGIVGLRVNHQLDVHIDGLKVTPAAK